MCTGLQVGLISLELLALRVVRLYKISLYRGKIFKKLTDQRNYSHISSLNYSLTLAISSSLVEKVQNQNRYDQQRLRK